MATPSDSDDVMLAGQPQDQSPRPRRRRRRSSRPTSVAAATAQLPGVGAGDAESGVGTGMLPQRPLPAMMDRQLPAKKHSTKRKTTKRRSVPVDAMETEYAKDQLDGDDVAILPTSGEVTESIPVSEPSAVQPVATLEHSNGEELTPTAAAPIMEIVVHSSSKLKANTKLSHPVVRVSLVDTETGQLFPKLHQERAAVSYYESQPQRQANAIQPIQTQPFSLSKHSTLAPRWQESLFINEDMAYFLEAENCLLFFEIMDFLDVKKVKSNKLRLLPWTRSNYTDSGWYCFAWAFLKLQTPSGGSNTESPVRLQLYKVPKIFHIGQNPADTASLPVFTWWKSTQRTRYAASLAVTVRGHTISAERAEVRRQIDPLRSMLPYQEEVGHQTYDQMHEETERRLANFNLAKDHIQESVVAWSRLPGQACGLPNKEVLRLTTGAQGCTAVKFSHSGRLIAIACGRSDLYGVVLYEIPGGYSRGQLLGHHNIVYDLSWSAEDTFVASASADGTVRAWNVQETVEAANCHQLAHPCFVYAAQYHPANDTLIATGGFDKILRAWSIEESPQLCQELEGHKGMINALCFDPNDNQLYSGDSEGMVIVWNTSSDKDGSWTKLRAIHSKDIKGISINSLSLSVGGAFLLVHTRNNAIRKHHSKTHRQMALCKGLLNYRERVRSCVSPCAGLILSGSEDKSVCVWDSVTGSLLHKYTDIGMSSTVADVDYHPFEHMIAFCCYSPNEPVLIYKKDVTVPLIDTTISRLTNDALSPQDPTELLQSRRSSPPKSAMRRSYPAIIEDAVGEARDSDVATPSLSPSSSPPTLCKTLGTLRTTGLVGSKVQEPSPSRSPQLMQKSRPAFADVAAQSIRLKRIAAKLDAVLLENKVEPSNGAGLDPIHPGIGVAGTGVNTPRPCAKPSTPNTTPSPEVLRTGKQAAHTSKGKKSSQRHSELQPTLTPSTPSPETKRRPKKPAADIRNVKAKLDKWKMEVERDQGSAAGYASQPVYPTGTNTVLSNGSSLDETWNTVWDDTPTTLGPTTASPGGAPGVDFNWKQSKTLVSAKYDYERVNDDELTIAVGDQLRLLHRQTDEWWYVEDGYGCRGYVPATYVQETDIQVDAAQHDATDGSSSFKPRPLREAYMQRSMSTDSRSKPQRLKSKFRRRQSNAAPATTLY